MSCSACGSPIAPSALSCPACRRLTHAAELEDLAKRAGAAWRIGDFTLERTVWVQSLALLPEDTVQHRLNHQAAPALTSVPPSALPPPPPGPGKASSRNPSIGCG